MNKWAKRYMEMAEQIASWSKDPNTKVGAVVVGTKGQILAQGYNGFPRKIKDTPSRLNNRDEKLKYVVHAEMNAIFNASLNGVCLDGATIFIHGLPICHECAKGIIQVGIKKAVIQKQFPGMKDVWKQSCSLGVNILQEAGIAVIEV
jgi:dCMP deaminase